MADREPISLSFGIEDTVDTGQAEILASLYDDSTVIADPNEIEEITSIEQSEPDPVKIEKGMKSQQPKLSDKEQSLNGDIDFAKILEASLTTEGEETDETVTDDEEEGEETEVVAKKPTTVKKESSTEDKTTDEPIWVSLSKDLSKLGIFTPDVDDDGNEVEVQTNTPEEFKDKFVNELKKGVNDTILNFLSRFGDDYKDAFDAIYVNGVNPKDYFETKLEVDNVKELDLTKENNQEYVVRKVLKDMGYEDDEANDEIERLKNYGDLESVSIKHHKILAKKEEEKLKLTAEAKAKDIETQKRIEDEYNDNVFKILNDKYKTKDFDGIPVNKQFAEKTMDFLTTKKYKLPTGELLTEWDKEMLELRKPDNHATKVKVAMILQLLKTDPTLTTLKKRAASEENNSVFNEVARHKTKKQTSTVTVKPKRAFID